MMFIRFILLGIIIYMIIRPLGRHKKMKEPRINNPGQDKNKRVTDKKVSKDTGEYVDYEELDK